MGDFRVSQGGAPWPIFGSAHAAANPSSHALKSRIRLTVPCRSVNERGDSVGSTRRCRTIRTTEKTKSVASAHGTSAIQITGNSIGAQPLIARPERRRIRRVKTHRIADHSKQTSSLVFTESNLFSPAPVQQWTCGSSRLRRFISTTDAKRTCANIGRDRQSVAQPLPFASCEHSVIPRSRQVGV